MGLSPELGIKLSEFEFMCMGGGNVDINNDSVPYLTSQTMDERSIRRRDPEKWRGLSSTSSFLLNTHGLCYLAANGHIGQFYLIKFLPLILLPPLFRSGPGIWPRRH
jgi:hypothetical protein